MSGSRRSFLGAGLAGIATAIGADASASGAARGKAGEWPVYGGDAASRKYSALRQINRDTVSSLEIAWIWRSPDAEIARSREGSSEALRIDHFKGTPLMVDGRLYVRSALGIVQALDPESGEPIWSFDPGGYDGGTPASYGFTTRGVAYWKDRSGRGRIYSTTADRHLVALDARTGALAAEFGEAGRINLDRSMRRLPHDPLLVNYGNQVPVLCADVVVLGSVITDAELRYLPEDPRQQPVIPPGDIRGFDAQTGRLLWTFKVVPDAGEPGVETWENDSWRWVGSTNAWSLMSADLDRGLVYVPLSSPTFNYFGGFRPGQNLYGDCLVCLDARTGRKIWHFQTIHHSIFDYDLPAAPVLGDVEIDGVSVPVVMQVSKTGYCFVFNRLTGAPIWPIVEREVPPSTTPGETASPTQPVPTRPPPFAHQGITRETTNGLTPEIRRRALEILARYDHGSLYTPVSLRGAILAPSIGGGANWPGGAFDPETNRFYVTAVNDVTIRGLVPADNYYGYRFRSFSSRIDNLPIAAPPWATITAIDMNHGSFAWQRPNGPGPKRHPLLSGLKLADLGTPSKSNPMISGDLLFAANSAEDGDIPQQVLAARAGPSISTDQIASLRLANGAAMRAFDKHTGELLWEHPIGPSFNDGGAPMTYMWKGRQYLVTPAGGGDEPAFLIAFALPENTTRLRR